MQATQRMTTKATQRRRRRRTRTSRAREREKKRRRTCRSFPHFQQHQRLRPMQRTARRASCATATVTAGGRRGHGYRGGANGDWSDGCVRVFFRALEAQGVQMRLEGRRRESQHQQPRPQE
jgi:hypothetical protein